MTVDVSGNVVGYDDYYPYGKQMNGRGYTSSADQRYKFTEKELDASDGLYYFGKRYYDSFRGQWLQVDPMEYKYPSWGSYNYCVDNPGRIIDPDGADLGWYDDGTGKPIFRADIHSQADLDNNGIKGDYISEQFTAIDTKTNTEMLYGINGGAPTPFMPLMNEVLVSGKNESSGNVYINELNAIVATTGASAQVMEGILKFDKGMEVAAPVFSKTMKGIGKTLGNTATLLSAVKLANHSSWTNATELGINVGLSILDTADPYVLGASISIGVMSATGLDDKVLNQLYNDGQKK